MSTLFDTIVLYNICIFTPFNNQVGYVHILKKIILLHPVESQYCLKYSVVLQVSHLQGYSHYLHPSGSDLLR